MQIVLVRHAKALDKDEARSRKISDSNRPLTPEGKKEFAAQVKRSLSLFKDVDLFVTSPYIRAKQTLDIILEYLPQKSKKIILKGITSEDEPVFLLEWLRTRPEAKIVIVSHEPFLSHFLNLVLPFGYEPRKIRKGDILQLERIETWQMQE